MTGFDEFYRAEFAGFVGLTTGLIGRRAGAEDLVQEAMIELYRRWDRVGAYDSPRGWVRRVIVQRAQKVAKKRSNERVAHLRAAPLHEGNRSTSDLIDEDLLDGLRGLPHQQRVAVVLHYLEDCSVKQLADEMGLAEGTVKVHLFRGRTALAEVLSRDSTGGGVAYG
ncbi:MAG: SigE family RNA polymerase sigma factor [Microthrixaceae bacterium]